MIAEPTNGTTIRLEYSAKHMHLVNLKGEVGCEVAPLQEEAPGSQSILDNFYTDLQYDSQADRITFTATGLNSTEPEGHCKDGDKVVTTLVRDKLSKPN